MRSPPFRKCVWRLGAAVLVASTGLLLSRAPSRAIERPVQEQQVAKAKGKPKGPRALRVARPPATGTQTFEDWIKPMQAPIGSLQPRAKTYSPDSAANISEQERLSKQDKRQMIEDQRLDKKLEICRS